MSENNETSDLAAVQTNKFLVQLMRQLSDDGVSVKPDDLGRALADELIRLHIAKSPHDQRLDGLMEHLLSEGSLLDPRKWDFSPVSSNEEIGGAFAEQMQNVLRMTLMILALYERAQTESN